MELLVKTNLVRIILNLGSYYPQLVHEFYVNLPSQFCSIDSPDYRKVHVRGHCFVLYTALINKFLDHRVDENVTEQRPSMFDLVFDLTIGVKRSWPKS